MPYMNVWEKRGYNKGIADGRRNEKKEIIHKLLLRGLSFDDIADISGMSLDYIQNFSQGLAQPVLAHSD